MRSMVEGVRHLRSARPGAPSTTPLRGAVPLPVPGRIQRGQSTNSKAGVSTSRFIAWTKLAASCPSTTR